MRSRVLEKTGFRNKRKGRRYPVLKPFQFIRGSHGEGTVLSGFIVDMSYSPGSGVSGIRVHVHERLEEGQEINMKSHHHPQRSSKATVRWVDHPDEATFRAGLMFIE
jgi:hypothetical protein